jgi:hypothetical protein
MDGYRSSFPGLERRGSEVNHSPPDSAEVKNERNFALLLLSRRGVHRENFYVI